MEDELVDFFKEIEEAANKYDKVAETLNRELLEVTTDITNFILPLKSFERIKIESSEKSDTTDEKNQNNFFQLDDRYERKLTPELLRDPVELNRILPYTKDGNLCNHQNFIQDLLQLIFQLHDQIETRRLNDGRSLEEERRQIQANVQGMMIRCKERIRKVTENARKRQVLFETESAKKMQDLQQQRRSLMEKLNETELDSRTSKYRTNLLQLRVERLEEQLKYAMEISQPALVPPPLMSKIKRYRKLSDHYGVEGDGNEP